MNDNADPYGMPRLRRPITPIHARNRRVISNNLQAAAHDVPNTAIHMADTESLSNEGLRRDVVMEKVNRAQRDSLTYLSGLIDVPMTALHMSETENRRPSEVNTFLLQQEAGRIRPNYYFSDPDPTPPNGTTRPK